MDRPLLSELPPHATNGSRSPNLKAKDGFEAPLTHSPGHSHRHSVYLPLSVQTSDGLFPFNGLSAGGLITPGPPKSPSSIHPIYADPNSPILPLSNPPTPPVKSPRLGSRPRSPSFAKRPVAYMDDPPAFSWIPPALLGPLDSPPAWLTYYFFANLGLTLYNKFVLVKFPFPWTMTGIHCLACTIGCAFLLQQGWFKPARVSRKENLTLIAFSALYALNIAISNVSLNLASVPFHQVVRATSPIFTMAINLLFLKKTYTTRVMVSLAPVVMGVGLATYGDYYFTAAGFILTIFGAVLASLKGVATNLLLVGSLRLHPLDLLLRMSPLAFIQCVAYAWVTGELAEVYAYSALEMSQARITGLVLNGAIAFMLNVVSFSANKKTSALTMTVAGNVKQCLTIVLAVWLFNVAVSFTNSMGILLTLVGGAWYARENYVLRKPSAKPTLSPLVEVVNEKAAMR